VLFEAYDEVCWLGSATVLCSEPQNNAVNCIMILRVCISIQTRLTAEHRGSSKFSVLLGTWDGVSVMTFTLDAVCKWFYWAVSRE